MPPRAFILEPAHVNVSKAEPFGELVYIWPKNSHRPSIWTSEFLQATTARLEDELDYYPTDDYFVVAGNMVPMAMVMTHLALRNGIIRLLLYSASERCYTERLIKKETTQ
jgi:hypothetical protein